MGHTPNRLEDHWREIKPLLKQEWPKLNDADLEYIDKEFDRLVEVIRQCYGGRVEIVQEAAIRDRLNQLLQSLES